MVKTSKIHEEMVIKANKFYNEWISGAYGAQGWPGPTGFQIPPDAHRVKVISIKDESYISVFNVCSVFKDEIYEAILNYDGRYIIYEISGKYPIGQFDKFNFYPIAEMRERKIDEILKDDTL